MLLYSDEILWHFEQPNQNPLSQKNAFFTVDPLLPSRGAPFGTYDVDYDAVPAITCGERWASGWWHEPHVCDQPNGNLNVPYEPSLEATHLRGILWPTDVGYKQVRTVQMKIRPIDYISPPALHRL